MNLMTAYRVAEFLKREGDKAFGRGGWKPEYGPQLFSKRRLKQFLNKQANIAETIDQMIEIGMLVEDGKGNRGSGKSVALSVTGREFLTNFLTRLDFVFRVSPAAWIEYLSRVDDKGRDPAYELEKIIREYVNGGPAPDGFAMQPPTVIPEPPSSPSADEQRIEF